MMQQLVAPAGCLDMRCVEMVKITDILGELSSPSSCVGGEMSVIVAILTCAVPGPRTFFSATQHPGGDQVSAPAATPQEPQAVCALKVMSSVLLVSVPEDHLELANSYIMQL
jgi:hypothetical protein